MDGSLTLTEGVAAALPIPTIGPVHKKLKNMRGVLF